MGNTSLFYLKTKKPCEIDVPARSSGCSGLSILNSSHQSGMQNCIIIYKITLNSMQVYYEFGNIEILKICDPVYEKITLFFSKLKLGARLNKTLHNLM